jgi:predicted component of type VI protein secretion system
VGLAGRTVAIGLFAVVLALVLGAVAGTHAGAAAGALAALAGLVPPALLAVAVEMHQRNAARIRSREEVLRRFAPPKPAGDGDSPAGGGEGQE